ncbi:homogentisate phytyltransferase 2 [Pyrus ussuriensis x Pyrus communis]|uniref:Homogentisate phytyltransferase 2 n=1 Tax=Pyrus ussuriensis x Pyrus communis TaxID=2448454 RepID=A0A5N5HZD1_9ROSA|nr:homogentisate phytyltransferase 2 [Pyrus ussuriensis x Pyrus communis]
MIPGSNPGSGKLLFFFFFFLITINSKVKSLKTKGHVGEIPSCSLPPLSLSLSPDMELSSLRFPAITPHCSTSSSLPPMSVRPTTTKSVAFLSSCRTKLNSIGVSRSSSKSLLSCQKRRNSTWACSQVGDAESDPVLTKVSDFKDACWRFMRPHTVHGTVLGSITLVARALIENSNLIKWSLLFKAFSGLFALLCGNNKSAWLLVVFFAVTGLLIVGLTSGPFITSLYCLGLVLCTIYSVPPLRMKRFPVAAFLIIASVRGFLFNFGVYYATRAALGLQFEWRFEISTFATKLGVRNIAFLGSGLLLLNYVGCVFAASLMPEAFRRSLMIPMHAILALSLVFQRFIWNLFYAEYILFPFI